MNTRHNEVVFSLNVYYDAHSLNKKRNIFKKKKKFEIIEYNIELKGEKIRSSYFCMFPDKNKTSYICYILYSAIFTNTDGHSS